MRTIYLNSSLNSKSLTKLIKITNLEGHTPRAEVKMEASLSQWAPLSIKQIAEQQFLHQKHPLDLCLLITKMRMWNLIQLHQS